MALKSVTFRWPKLRRADVKRDAWHRNAGLVAHLRPRRLEIRYLVKLGKTRLYWRAGVSASVFPIVFQKSILTFSAKPILRHCAQFLVPHATQTRQKFPSLQRVQTYTYYHLKTLQSKHHGDRTDREEEAKRNALNPGRCNCRSRRDL
jgi:hypothetical protein